MWSLGALDMLPGSTCRRLAAVAPISAKWKKGTRRIDAKSRLDARGETATDERRHQYSKPEASLALRVREVRRKSSSSIKVLLPAFAKSKTPALSVLSLCHLLVQPARKMWSRKLRHLQDSKRQGAGPSFPRLPDRHECEVTARAEILQEIV